MITELLAHSDEKIYNDMVTDVEIENRLENGLDSTYFRFWSTCVDDNEGYIYQIDYDLLEDRVSICFNGPEVEEFDLTVEEQQRFKKLVYRYLDKYYTGPNTIICPHCDKKIIDKVKNKNICSYCNSNLI